MQNTEVLECPSCHGSMTTQERAAYNRCEDCYCQGAVGAFARVPFGVEMTLMLPAKRGPRGDAT